MEPCPDCQKWRGDYVLMGEDNSIVHLCKCEEEKHWDRGVALMRQLKADILTILEEKEEAE